MSIIASVAAWLRAMRVVLNISTFALALKVAIFQAQLHGTTLLTVLSAFSVVVPALLLFVAIVNIRYASSVTARHVLLACEALVYLGIGIPAIISAFSGVECRNSATQRAFSDEGYAGVGLSRWCEERKAVSILFLVGFALCVITASLSCISQRSSPCQTDHEAQPDRAVSTENPAPQPATFFCSIHQDSHPDTVIIRIEPCSHPFCQDGLRDYISSKLNARELPGSCPLCMADTSTGGEGGTQSRITPDLAHRIGVDKRDYELWADLEMRNVCVEVHCPRCSKSFFVDRRDCHSDQIDVCPLQSCQYRWCKICKLAVATGVEHSCDGVAEVEQLAKLLGWKKCPGCGNLIQKRSGCDHMKCELAGCNTHFCYRCGGLIARTATAAQTLLDAHNQACPGPTA